MDIIQLILYTHSTVNVLGKHVRLFFFGGGGSFLCWILTVKTCHNYTKKHSLFEYRCDDIMTCWSQCRSQLRNECLFFSVHGIWIAVRNKQIAWTAKRFSCDLFVSALRFISHEPRKKDTHSLYLQCLQQRPLLKFSEQSKKFKFPAEIGHLTLFPDKTIIAYSFRQNSAWINGEKVVCCECFHTLKQY